jgi:predicted flavoprotein YhiN
LCSALEIFLKKYGVIVVRGRASSVEKKNKDGTFTTQTCDGKMFSSRSVVICTGGMSYPATGSTGDGYKIASNFGHVIRDLSPSLVGIETTENWCESLMGLSLKNVVLCCKKRDENTLQ